MNKYGFILLILIGMVFAENMDVILYPNIAYLQHEFVVNRGYFAVPINENLSPQMSSVSLLSDVVTKYGLKEIPIKHERMRTFDEMLNESLNKEVSFYYGDRQFEGNLIWYDKLYLGIEDENGVSVFPISKLYGVVLPVDSTFEEEAKVIGVVGYSEKDGLAKLEIKYSGLSWRNYYDLVLSDLSDDFAELSLHSEITNNGNYDFRDIELHLVSITPNIIDRFLRPVYMKAYSLAASPSNDGSLENNFEYSSGLFNYDLEKPISIPANSKISMEVFRENVDVDSYLLLEEYDKNPWQMVKIKNPSTELFPAGVMKVYLKNNEYNLKDVFIGEVNFGALAGNESEEFRLYKVPTIEAKFNTKSNLDKQEVVHITKEVSVKNYDASRHSLYIKFNLPTSQDNFKIESTSHDIVERGEGWVKFKIILEPNSSDSVIVKYSYLRDIPSIR